MKRSSRIHPSDVGFSGSEKVVYEDLQVSLSTQKLPAANAPTWRTFAYGIVGGVLFDVLGFDLNDTITFKVQTKHAVKLNTMLDSHIHWTIPSDSAADRIKFQLDVIAAGIDEAYAVPTGSPFSNEHLLVGDEYTKHKLLDIADIPAANTTVSTIYQCRLTRIIASIDDYVPEVYLDFNDSHVQLDTMGSLNEGSKV